MSNKKKIIIIELGQGHFELIPSHLLFLKKRKYEVFYAGHFNDRSVIQAFKNDLSKTIFIEKSKNIKSLLSIRRFILDHKIDQVLFNTASGRSVLLLSILIPIRVYLTGVLHDVGKLSASNTQKMISFRIKNYFVLSRFLYNTALLSKNKKWSFQYFYSIYYKSLGVSENNNELKIVIPSNIQTVRRDYFGFLAALSSIPIESLKNIKFILLGNINKDDGFEVKNMISDQGILDYFEFHNSYVPDKEFHRIIASANYIMPLIHPNVLALNGYNSNKISGSFNLAFGHKKPLLVHEVLRETNEFDAISIYYSLENMECLFKQIRDIDVTKFKIEYEKDERFDEQKQEERYFSLLK